MTKNAIIRKDFPILRNDVAFLDSGASAQKPQCVLDTVDYFSKDVYANVHRGTYDFSQEITTAFEQARVKVAEFIGGQENEVVFTKNATEAINLVAYTFGSLLPNDAEIIISEMEHHANIVPWQLLSQYKNLTLKICPVLETGDLDMVALKSLITDKTALVAITHISNVLGTVNDIKTIAQLAHAKGAKVLIDGSQGIVHEQVDVVALDVDFYVFTGHKLYAPTGIGVLWGRAEILESMPPFLSGGDMIESVSFEKTTFAKIPAKFEAGTPPIVQAIGLGRAIDYVTSVGMETLQRCEQEVFTYAMAELAKIPDICIIGNSKHKAPIISFTVTGVHSYDIAEILNNYKVCVRVGKHCAEPLMKRFGVDSTLRISLAPYNTTADIDKCIIGLNKAIGMLK